MKNNALKSSVLFGLVLLASSSYGFDLGDSLKNAVKKNIPELNPAPPASTQADSPATNDNAGNDLSKNDLSSINLSDPSIEDEIKLGREITGNLLGASALVKDEALQKYVNWVGRWVASQSERPDLPWHFGVIESDDINAFAAPGGYVLLTKGLYRQLESESQLAGVLGHEIAHVVQKHHLKVLQKSQFLNLGANLLGSKVGKDNQIAQKLIGNGAEIMARGLDKDAEYEADRMGLVLAARAGYDAYGLTEVLAIIGNTSKTDSSVALLYKTHPSPEERLGKLAEATGSRLDKVTAGKTLNKQLYVLKN